MGHSEIESLQRHSPYGKHVRGVTHGIQILEIGVVVHDRKVQFPKLSSPVLDKKNSRVAFFSSGTVTFTDAKSFAEVDNREFPYGIRRV